MTEKEKFIAARSAAKILEYNACKSYRDEMMLQWCINNESCKMLNRMSNELYHAKRVIDSPSETEQLEQRLNDIYAKKLQLQADMLNAEICIHIPKEITSGKTSAISRKNAVEKYIQLQMFILLSENAPLDDPEISAMIQWCSMSQKISEVGKKIQKQYAIYHYCTKNGKPKPDIKELNRLKKEQAYYKNERDDAEKILRDVAEMDNLASPFRQNAQKHNQPKKR